MTAVKQVVIAGAGPAGLMAAYFLSKNKAFQVHVFDANKAIARKFLVAGHGGFNLTNAEATDTFIEKYNHPLIQDAVRIFSNEATMQWLSEIGIETFVGSSGKIFPEKGIKPIQVLTKWMNYLEKNDVIIHTEHQLVDFTGNSAVFQHGGVPITVEYDYLIMAFGGASWKKTGSTGEWTDVFRSKQLEIIPFQASNAGIVLSDWNPELGGGVLKNTEISINGNQRFGEIELTAYGLEGAPVYALSNEIRKGTTELVLNLKPVWTSEQLKQKHTAFKGSKTEFLHAIKLSKPAVRLLKHALTREDFTDDARFLNAINHLGLSITDLRPVEEAISTVGGLSMDEINASFRLNKYENHYCIGEMLDWNAPTGGYLLQACFASGYVAAQSVLKL